MMMTMMQTAMRPILLSFMLCIALLGCGKVNTENYNKLQAGMSYAEVQQILGTPSRCSDVLTMKNCTWGDERRYINVSFVGDKVVLFTSENIR